MNRRGLNSELNLAFWFHLLITSLAWFGPFLFSWYLMVTAYLLVILQFLIFGRCLLNKSHGLDADKNEATFYSVLMDALNITNNPVRVKYWVRKWVYPIFAVWTLIYQELLGFEPLLF